MDKPFVSLRSEVTRNHAFILMDWLDDQRVVQYLSDPQGVSRFISQAIERTPLPILTHLFNQGGRFFMVHDRNDLPVGFVRLVKSGPECEIVVVIGDHDSWGRRLGASTISEGLKVAFLEMRARSVIAKIHSNNVRSLKAFLRCGFAVDNETAMLKSLSMPFSLYLRLLRNGSMASSANIHVTEIDKGRLQELIVLEQGPAVVELEHEIERAIVVAPERVGREVVTMNSKVLLTLDGESQEVALVYPKDADEPAGKISVLTDIGAAILGYQKGDVIDSTIADRARRIKIERVLYQPESFGRFHL